VIPERAGARALSLGAMRAPRLPHLRAAGLAALALLAPAVAAAQEEGPLRNSVPLPAARDAEAAIVRGDTAWAAARDGSAPGAERQAFDEWQRALEVSAAGDGVRFAIPDAPAGLFPDPDGLAERRAEGVAEAILRRLHAIGGEARAEWSARFAPAAEAALARAIDSAAPAAFARVERDHPATDAALRAALALVDLELEAGRPAAAAAWLARARRHADLLGVDDDRIARALRVRAGATTAATRARAAGLDHSRVRAWTRPSDEPDRAGPPAIRPLRTERIIGLTRAASDPLGRGLGTGVAVLRDGTVIVQSALALLALPADGGPAQRGRTEEVLGVGRASIRATAASGGWPSLPATNGEIVAVVVGRAERPRTFLDVASPAIGNVIGVLGRGADGQLMRTRWSMRDGIAIDRPDAPEEGEVDPVRPAPLGGGRAVPGWDLGRGWEFQPGPILADGAIFALARGLGDPTQDEVSHADELRLIALEADGSGVRWSREVTRERGTPGDTARGRASLFAATAMPLTLDETNGTLLVGTNVGLLCAYDVADGRLLWALRRQRAAEGREGWSGSEAPRLAPLGRSRAAWFAPLSSQFAYPIHSGPPRLDGTLLAGPPRPAGAGQVLAGLRLPEDPSGQPDLALLGRAGRYDAVLLDRAPDPRRGRERAEPVAAAFAAPDDAFTGSAAVVRGHLFAATDAELLAFDPVADFALVAAAPLEAAGAGRGGNVVALGDTLVVAGRDTVWLFRID